MVAAWRRGALRMAMLVSMLLFGAAAGAAPADDHERGLQAYRRGDVVTAMAALRGPAQAGHAPSQSLLAFILDRADYRDEAARLYRDAAAQDDAEGHAGLASLYLTGRGVAKDEKLALRHFSKAAELGHAASVDMLADAYLKKQFGLDADGPDAAGAVSAWRRAAAQGHLASAQALALAYRVGRHGVAVDAVQAASWQARADELRKQQQAAAPAARVPNEGRRASPPGSMGRPCRALCLALGGPAASLAGDALAGADLYRRHCASCHGADGRPVLPAAPDLSRPTALLKPDLALLGTIRGGRGAMPAYAGQLRDREILDIVTHLRTLR